MRYVAKPPVQTQTQALRRSESSISRGVSQQRALRTLWPSGCLWRHPGRSRGPASSSPRPCYSWRSRALDPLAPASLCVPPKSSVEQLAARPPLMSRQPPSLLRGGAGEVGAARGRTSGVPAAAQLQIGDQGVSLRGFRVFASLPKGIFECRWWIRGQDAAPPHARAEPAEAGDGLAGDGLGGSSGRARAALREVRAARELLGAQVLLRGPARGP